MPCWASTLCSRSSKTSVVDRRRRARNQRRRVLVRRVLRFLVVDRAFVVRRVVRGWFRCADRGSRQCCAGIHAVLRQLELNRELVQIPQLGEGRQLLQFAQTEIVEELARSAEQLGSSRYLAMTHDPDPVAFEQRPRSEERRV